MQESVEPGRREPGELLREVNSSAISAPIYKVNSSAISAPIYILSKFMYC